MKAEGVAVLVILIIGIAFIAMLAMPMFDKIPTPDNPDSKGLVQNVSIPMVEGYSKGLTAFDIGLGVVAIIGVMILVYGVVYRK
jgi:hypothetical protein